MRLNNLHSILRRKDIKNFLYMFSSNIFSFITNIIISILIFSFLTVQDYGKYSIAIDFMNMVTLTFGSLFTNALQRFSSYYRIKKDFSRLSGLLMFSFVYALFISASISLFSFIFNREVSLIFLKSEVYAPFIKIYSLGIPFMILAIYVSAWMKGMNMFNKVSLYDITLPSLFRAIFIALFLPFFSGIGTYIISFSYVVKYIVNFAFNIFTSRYILLKILFKKEKMFEIKDWLYYSFFTWLKYTFSIISRDIKSVLVGSIKGSTEGGVYKTAHLLFSPVYIIETTISTLLFTKMSEIFAANKDIHKVVLKYTFYISVLQFLMGFLILLGAPIVLNFFGKGYENAIPLLSVLFLSYIINSLSSAHKTFFLAIGKSNINFIIHALSTMIYIFGGIYLINLYGALGGIYAFLIGAILSTIIAFVIYFLYTKRSPIDTKVFFISILSIVMIFLLR